MSKIDVSACQGIQTNGERRGGYAIEFPARKLEALTEIGNKRPYMAKIGDRF